MFKRENRLVPGVKFNNSFFSADPQFILKEKKNGLTVNRFGIVVSKKIDKRAVARNKVKRFFRQALSELNKNMHPGHDIILIIKKEILNKTQNENLLTIKNALRKAGVMRNKD